MRAASAVALVLLVSSRDSMQQKVHDSRQDRCECGEMFKPLPYQEGFQKGRARKPSPAV